MNYIILNDVNSNTIQGLIIQNLPPITKPQIRTNIEEIDGRDGDIITKLGYSAYDKEFDIGLYGSYDVNEVISYFNSEGTVIFSNEDDKFYKYTIIEQIDFERLIRFKTAKVKMHVQPFKYSNTDEDIEIYATETDAEGTNITINNTENGASFLDMQLKGQTTQDGTPTPTSPVNVNVVTGLNTIKVGNKNLIDKANFTPSGTYTDVTITNNNDGTLTLNGTTTANRSYIISPNPNYYNEEQFGTYSYKCFGLPSTCYTNIYYGSNVNGEDVYNLNVNTANRNYAMILVIPSGTTLSNVTIKPMLVKGSYTSSNFPSYIAHQEQNYTINLGTNELCEIGGYQDYIYKNNGNWFIHKEIGKVVLDGTESGWSNSGTNTSGYNRFSNSIISDLVLKPSNSADLVKGICDTFKVVTANNTYGRTDGLCVNASGTIYIYYSEVASYTATNFKTWLSTHNTTLYYALATPTITEITDTNLIAQLDALRNASTYINQTNIITGGDLAPIIYVNVDTIDTNEIEVINSGNYFSKPVVTITGIGTINLYLNDYQVFIIDLGDTETTITLDVENMEAYNINTGQLMNRQVTGDYNNFIFNSGTNIITWSGTIASVQVVNYSRWL